MRARMKETRGGKIYLLAVAVLAVLLAAGGLVAVLLRGQSFETHNPNLALGRGVKATSDSVEQEALSAAMAIDGNDEDRASRWSSENNREDASHYIRLEFPKEISVSFVVLKWERANAVSYALEGSVDGTAYETLAAFDMAPETLAQEIVLAEPVNVRFLRLFTYAVSKEAADYSDLYQNVSLYEFEVYGDKPTAYKLETPVIEKTAEGGRKLVMPEAPEGFRVTLIGADLEQVIGADGTVYDTVQDKEVTVGYRVEDTRGLEETREVSFAVTVPASESGEPGGNACPDWLVPSLAEWRGGEGDFVPGMTSRIVVDTDSRPPGKGGNSPAETGKDTEADKTAAGQALWEVATLMQELCKKQGHSFVGVTVCKGTQEDIRPGDIYLGYAETENGLGKEGYTCDITDKCVIKAETATGVRWGTVTLMQLLFQTGGSAPQGRIRDYPLYEVRGFGIDVARKAVSIDTLYRMMETMSWYKMNDLTIHLNDNEILATSGLMDSAEHAMTADSAFRLESALGNEKGETLTSAEYAYTQEEFAALIATAKTYGVTVVPEIDTPAHSLSITKLYPEYALRTSNESVDQIDLGNDNAVAFVEQIWQEALDVKNGAFREAEIVGIGMDEYYGDGEQYRQYLTRINDLAQEAGKTVRLWGSLSNMGGTTNPQPENLQMNLWSTVWADPQEMYEAGYSLINMQNNHLYLIPGGGYDRLDGRELYENWAPNRFYDYNRRETIPSYSPQMLGAAYMIWNDMCGRLDVGISEYDLYERFEEPLLVLAAKLWGREEKLSFEEFSAVAERIGQASSGADGERNRLCDETVGLEPYYEVEIRVRLTEGSSPQDDKEEAAVIARSDSPYGEWAFYAVEAETGCVGFAREGRTYTWDYRLPRGEWVQLKVVGEPGRTTLYVDGRSVGTLGNETPFEEYATFIFPIEYIGEETGAFDGEAELTVMSDE